MADEIINIEIEETTPQVVEVRVDVNASQTAVDSAVASQAALAEITALIENFDPNEIYGVFYGSAKPTDIVTVTDAGYWVATEPGIYVNFGGLVVDVNSLAVISRNESGDFSITQTEIFQSIPQEMLDDSLNIFNLNVDSQSGVWSSVNGLLSASNNWISTKKISVNSNTQYTVSGLSSISSSIARVLYYTSAGTYISNVLSTGTSTNVTFTTPSNCVFVAFNLKNELNVGLNPTASQYVASLMLQIGTIATPFEVFGTKLLKQAIKDAYELYPDCFVSFNPIGYTTPSNPTPRELITIYTKRGNSNRYVGHVICHEIDNSEAKFQDLYRLLKADEYVYNGTNMSLLYTGTLIEGENECVYLIPSKLDFVGGTHGNEKQLQVNLYVDGQLKSLTSAFSLLPCKTAWYIQKSTMHEPPTAGGIVAVGHPIDAYHYKKTTFDKNGYVTENTMDWVRVVNLSLWYIGIVCVGRKMADYCYNEKFEQQTMVSSNGFYFEDIGQKKVEYYSLTNKNGCTVFTDFISDNIADKLCGIKVWDRSSDAKYYRYTPAYNTVIGSSETAITKVIYR